jgi:hypothetical protein
VHTDELRDGGIGLALQFRELAVKVTLEIPVRLLRLYIR